jgi:hypothetical protein
MSRLRETSNQAPSPNRRPRLPLGGLVSFDHLYCAPPAFAAAAGEAQCWARLRGHFRPFYETNWTAMTFDDQATLWRPSAVKYWEESQKIDLYGVLFPTSRSPENIWDGDNGKGKK